MTPIRLYTAIRDAMEKHFGQPMNPARSINALALLELCGERVASMSEHAATLKLTSAGITHLTDRMEKQRLIERKNPPHGDRRQWDLHITPKGREVLAGIYHDTRVALSRAKAQQAEEATQDNRQGAESAEERRVA